MVPRVGAEIADVGFNTMVRRYVRLLLSQIVGEETWSTARTHGYRRSLAWTVLPLDLGAREPFNQWNRGNSRTAQTIDPQA